jgi:hypothetical protein
VADVPLPPPGVANPLIRLNAFAINKTPDVFRHLYCDIGGTRDVRNALQSANADAVAVKRHGVISFGADDEIRRAFSPYGIREFDLRPVDLSDSSHLGLIYEALMRAFARERPVRILRRGPRYFAVPDPDRTADPIYSRLRTAAKPIGGTIEEINCPWWHACRLRIDFYVGRPWLLLNPTVITELGEERSDEIRFAASAFTKPLVDHLYNARTDQLLNAWAAILLGEEDSITVRTFGISDGVDATFEVVARSAYSRLGRAV